MPAASNIVDLRRLLAERFPAARLRPPPVVETHPTGVPALDQLLGGGLPKGEITELVALGPGSGSAQMLHALLRGVAERGDFLAVVDGADSFDVDPVEPFVLERLLWVRCRRAEEAMKAADLLLRDRNLPLVVLDLKLNRDAELRRISSSAWFRFSRLAEHNGTTLLVITPHQLVGAAGCRVRIESRLGVESLAAGPAEAREKLRFELLRAAGTDGRAEEVRVA
jgi:hypothetical protein